MACECLTPKHISTNSLVGRQDSGVLRERICLYVLGFSEGWDGIFLEVFFGDTQWGGLDGLLFFITPVKHPPFSSSTVQAGNVLVQNDVRGVYDREC
jgi:hypothetical protein